ncbi:transposase [Thioclava dalianensis]|uniref:transposase n=1 Tax=Thioclava dalianensis TaxID=1185766 RepID=UPI003CCC17FB
MSSILHMAGLNWPVHGFFTLSRRKKNFTVGIPSCRSPGARNLLVDSTEIKPLVHSSIDRCTLS